MSERDYSSLENQYVSNRVLLCNASVYDIKDKYEAKCLNEYLNLVGKVDDAHEQKANLQQHIKGQTKQAKIDELKSTIKDIENQIVQYNVTLSKMETEYPLYYVIQRIREKEQSTQGKHKQPEQTKRKARSPKKKCLIKALNKLYDEGVFTALTYIITSLWFGYLVNVVATADSHIIGKIFFIIWSLVLAFLFVIHKCGGSGDD